MGKPAYPLRTKMIALCAAGLLACGLAPLVGFAQEPVAGGFTPPAYESDARSASPNSALSFDGEGAILASSLASNGASIISADVALDASDPVVGSFTAGGLTYALNDGKATLISVGATFVVAPYEGSADSGDGNAIAIPASVTYNGVAYPVTAIGPYAFYLSGATDVTLPGSIASVDDRAFRSSDVGRVEVVADNPNIASYDGALYSADKLCLLLIPEGRAGAVLLPCEAEVVEPSVFSHCSLVDAISAGEGGAAFASWEGLLYDASGTTLLRVPAGAVDITIREGCTTIAAGAMEGCAKLERITAPASVTSISPDVFESVPTITLPAQSALQDDSQVDSVAGPLAGPGYEGDARSASADSSGAEGDAEASPRRVVAESQGDGAEEAEGAFGSEVLTSPQPPSASSAESADVVASSLLDQANASADSAPQLTAMVALSSADDDLPEVDPTSIEVALPEGADEALWQHLSFAIAADRVAPSQAASYSSIASSAAYDAAPVYTVRVYPNGHTIGVREAYWNRTTQSLHSIAGDYSIGPGSNPAYLQSAQVTSWTPNVGSVNVDEGNNTWGGNANITFFYTVTGKEPGWVMRGVSYDPSGSSLLGQDKLEQIMTSATLYCIWRPASYTIKFDARGGSVSPSSIAATYAQDLTLPAPAERPGYRFLGWNTAADGSGTAYQPGTARNLTAADGATITLFAQWSYSLGFDTDSEPDDVDYPGEAIDDRPVTSDEGQVVIEDPKRPGYVFEGWVIPSADGTEAIDQDLVYQGDDGKWYVDASKLPDYAGDDGRVGLTARWTSVISVDVPSSVTFYADLVTQGQESREGAASSAFGQSQVSNQSQVDLRVVGLESSAVKTTDSTLGADSILKKKDGSTVSGTADKLLSLYPTTGDLLDGDDLRDPDAVSASKPDGAVDFSLDDVLLEKSFKADDFTIPVGETRNMGYRLNLEDTNTVLDYDRLSILSEGQSASIANVSYCFAADALPSDWGEPLWVENPDRSSNPAKYLLLKDIKAAANDLSANGASSQYYSLYKDLLDAGTGFHLKVGDAYHDVQVLDICQDSLTTPENGRTKAGLTFGFKELYARNGMASNNAVGWNGSWVRSLLQGDFYNKLDSAVQSSIARVTKVHQQVSPSKSLQVSTNQTVFVPSMFEVFGGTFTGTGGLRHNASEVSSDARCFQYQHFSKGGQTSRNLLAQKTWDGSPQNWWLRGAGYDYTGYNLVSATGYVDSSSNTTSPSGVLPCFCL